MAELSLEDLLSGLEAAQQKKSKVMLPPYACCHRCHCRHFVLHTRCLLCVLSFVRVLDALTNLL